MTAAPSSLLHENAISLAQAARRVPPFRFDNEGRPKPVTTSCVLRWILNGARGPGGRVRLEGQRIGGRWITSAEALDRFAAALTPAPDRPAAPRRGPRVRRRAAERAARRLEEAGI